MQFKSRLTHPCLFFSFSPCFTLSQHASLPVPPFTSTNSSPSCHRRHIPHIITGTFTFRAIPAPLWNVLVHFIFLPIFPFMALFSPFPQSTHLRYDKDAPSHKDCRSVIANLFTSTFEVHQRKSRKRQTQDWMCHYFFFLILYFSAFISLTKHLTGPLSERKELLICRLDSLDIIIGIMWKEINKL